MKVKLEVTDDHLRIIGAALIEMPYKIAVPVLDEINRQIAGQHERDGEAESG